MDESGAETVLPSGRRVTYKTLDMQDILPFLAGKIKPEHVAYYLASKCAGLTLEEFFTLPINDGLRILADTNKIIMDILHAIRDHNHLAMLSGVPKDDKQIN